MASFERILWFACRGNVFLRTEDIVQPMEDPGSVSIDTLNANIIRHLECYLPNIYIFLITVFVE